MSGSHEEQLDEYDLDDATHLDCGHQLELVVMVAKIAIANPCVTKLLLTGQDFTQPGATRALGIGK